MKINMRGEYLLGGPPSGDYCQMIFVQAVVLGKN